jgi:hypothetical protein
MSTIRNGTRTADAVLRALRAGGPPVAPRDKTGALTMSTWVPPQYRINPAPIAVPIRATSLLNRT